MLQDLISPEQILLIVIFLGIGFPLHEAAHAYAAYLQGDGTAKLFGRLTLNPVRHFDPIGGLLLVATILLGTGFIIGWAKPTPVNPQNLRDRRNGEMIVALAGPATNLIVACVAALGIRGLDAFWPQAPDFLVRVLFGLVIFNIALTIFNLIPIPPLDGSTVLFRFLDPATAWRARMALAQYGFLVLILVIFFFGPQLGRWMYDISYFLVGA